MRKQARKLIDRLIGLPRILNRIEQTQRKTKAESEQTRVLLGKLLANQVRAHGVYEDIHDAEFKVFSQFGDDGILQYLVGETQPLSREFIEFGVQDYTESNTRFLLINDNWTGLIIDCDPANIESVRRSRYYWRYGLQAIAEFLDRENVNSVFEVAGFSGEIGLLSIDIDGNDYWVWDAIQVVDPVLVTVEYNSVFGADRAITIPYDPAFFRTRAHYSNLYYGASLKAFCMLAEKKGYAFVGCNSAGNNAHFVRKDALGSIPAKTATEGYVESRFRESKNMEGHSTFLRGRRRLEVIKDMQVLDLESNQLVFLRDLLN